MNATSRNCVLLDSGLGEFPPRPGLECQWPCGQSVEWQQGSPPCYQQQAEDSYLQHECLCSPPIIHRPSCWWTFSTGSFRFYDSVTCSQCEILMGLHCRLCCGCQVLMGSFGLESHAQGHAWRAGGHYAQVCQSSSSSLHKRADSGAAAGWLPYFGPFHLSCLPAGIFLKLSRLRW